MCSFSFLRNWNAQSYPSIFACFRMASLISSYVLTKICKMFFCILSMSHLLLTFIIDISSFYNGLKHPCNSKPIFILRATLFKVVMKCKTFMFFNFFGLFFSPSIKYQILFHPVTSIKFYFTQYQVSNQLNFSMVVCICKIHVFNKAFFLLKHFPLIFEKMSLTYFHSNSC